LKWNPVLIGSALGLFSAAVYTCTNICLREVARSDPFWVSCIKATPTLLLASGLLIYRRLKGQRSWPGWPILGLLVVVGLIAQVLGNVMFQYALGVVGIALSVPLTFGTLILSGAVLGRMWLKEPITPRAAIAVTLLIASIAILSTGAKAAERVVESGTAEVHSPWHVALGVGAACISGVAYGLLGVVLRGVTPANAPLGATLFVISGVGTISLGLWSVSRLGWSGLIETPAADFSYMWWAGVFNAVAFVALIQALSIAPLVHVNAVNSSQTAMAAVAGILIFGEPLTLTLALGVGLTTAGLLLLDHREKKPQHEPATH
jgi:drug/metabolite transporter (DMT)-like permease